MIRIILTTAPISVVFIDSLFANDFNKLYSDEIQRISSTFAERDSFIFVTSYPISFDELNNPADEAAIPTGYCFVDSNDDVLACRIDVKIYDTVAGKYNINYVRCILPGLRIFLLEYWTNNPDE